jgi:predicted NBD/HSP70 family sugar kinase
MIASVAAAARQLLSKTRVPRHRILGLAVTTAGAVTQASGRVVASSLTVLEGRDLAADLSGCIGFPAIVETIGNTFGLAEAHRRMREGASAMAGPSLVIHVAFGLGVSVMLDGHPIRTGGDERASGHVPVAGGLHRCICGAQGCLMTEAAGYGILRRLARIPTRTAGQRWEDVHPEALRGAVVRAQAGEAEVVAVMAAAGKILGRHLFDIGAVVTPRRILLGGPLATVPAFVEGVGHGLADAHSRVGSPAPSLQLSETDYLHATELLAIEEFALRRSLPLGSTAAA